MNMDNTNDTDQSLAIGMYVYRMIATNFEGLNNSEIVYFYNQRAEDSENRIKELKDDFGAKQMSCSNFAANALYFNICSFSYHLFALMRQLVPLEFVNKRAKYVRHRFYNIDAKVIQHGRQIMIKC